MKRDKVLFFHPFTMQSPNFPTVLDEALEFSNSNPDTEVLMYKCRGEIQFCQQNPRGSKLNCLICQYVFDRMVRCFDDERKIKVVHLDDFINADTDLIDFDVSTLNSFDELKNFKKAEIDLGSGILSSYMDITRNDNWEKLDKVLLSNLTYASIFALNIARAIEKALDLRSIFIFNGRLHDNKPFLNYFSSKFKNYIILETVGGRVKQDYQKHRFYNSRPHSISTYAEQVINNWEVSQLSNCRVQVISATGL
ncbi:hypothetical protein CLV31_109177 [Algoriphagus aquaeductus]|uniref:Uncharacterized protein n=1 Tax=Algoriphagus aquaeductus TaxID=475299 RepID=A0A326RQJ8_9BACT|nr:hypothetical protein [Algoriphagus aquaeductus]PZV82316.1 hypothetical protein CLV31_109177 [Algoriphagus aquaeductus]